MKMNKIFVILVAAIISIGFLSGTASAAWKARASTELNLRNGPSTRYAVIGVIPSGGKVRVHSCRYNWCRVSYRGRHGWASRRFLNRKPKRHYHGYNPYQPQYHRPPYPFYPIRPFPRPRVRPGFSFFFQF